MFGDGKKKKFKIGILGLGTVGAPLSYSLAEQKQWETIVLYSRNREQTKGLALDLQHAFPFKKFIATKKLTEFCSIADVIIITFCSRNNRSKSHQNERWNKLKIHLKEIKEILKILGRVHFSGTIFVVTNPCDVLAFCFYRLSQRTSWPLFDFNVYGLGLALDKNRAQYYLQKNNYSKKNIYLMGSHDTKLIVYDISSKKKLQKITNLVTESYKSIGKLKKKTIYGPIQTIKETLNAWSYNKKGILTYPQNESYFGEESRFSGGLPSFANTPSFLQNDKKKLINYHKDISNSLEY